MAKMIYSIKKGFWQKSKKDISESLNVNKLFKWLSDQLHVTTYDDCCDSETTTRPIRVDITTGNVEYFNGLEFRPTSELAAQTITAGTGGAISVRNYLTTIATDAGGDAFTLADGVVINQLKKIILGTDGGGNATITFTGDNLTTIVMNDATDFVILKWNGLVWLVEENSGCTIS